MDSLIEENLTAFRLGIEQYVSFTDEEWKEFAHYTSAKTLKKKKFLAEPGKVCNEIAFVTKGSVRYYHIKDGEEITGYFSFENDFASAYKSFLRRDPSTYYIQALEDSAMMVISFSDMQKLYAHPTLGHKCERFGRLVAENYMCCFEDRVASFITKTPEERYHKLLETGGEVLQRIPQHYIANFLGITPVSLSRIRRRIMKISA